MERLKLSSIKGKFFPFFISTILFSTFYPFFLQSNLGIFLLHLLIIVVMIAGIYLIRFQQKVFFLGITLGIIDIALTILVLNFGDYWLILFLWNIGILLFYLLISVNIFILVIQSKKVSLDTIMGAISGYFILAVTWAMLFHLIEILIPGSFKFPEGVSVSPDIFIYYAQITLTSVGYGDIIPLNPISRSASAILAMTGQVYLAVILGILIGIYLKNKSS